MVGYSKGNSRIKSFVLYLSLQLTGLSVGSEHSKKISGVTSPYPLQTPVPEQCPVHSGDGLRINEPFLTYPKPFSVTGGYMQSFYPHHMAISRVLIFGCILMLA